MSSSEQLKKAYSLIKSGRKEEALRLIKPVLRSERDNAAGWWLLANAIDDPVRQEKALKTVLRLRPGEPKATRMLQEIQQPHPIDEDDPFDVLDSDDDPFAEDPFAEADAAPSRNASRNGARRKGYIASASAAFDDPFADYDPAADDPFGDDPFASSSPRPRSHATSGGQSGTVTVTKKGGGSGPLLIGVGMIGIIAVIGVAVFFLVGSSATSTLSTEGNCDIGQTAHSSMTTIECSNVATDSRWSGRLNVNERHDWMFTASAGQTITVDVEGDTLYDPVVELHTDSGDYLEYNDDGGEGLDSSLTTTFSNSGTYIFRVRSFNEDSGGEYFISFREGGARVANSSSSSGSSSSTSSNGNSSSHCDIGRVDRSFEFDNTRISCSTVSVDSRVTGRLNESEEHAWSFNGESGQRVTIELSGINGEDVYLELYNRSGRLIAENDDINLGAGNYNSRLTVTLTGTETYTIVARTWSSFDEANYELRVN